MADKQYAFIPMPYMIQWSPNLNSMRRSPTYPFMYIEADNTRYIDYLYMISQDGNVYYEHVGNDFTIEPDRYADRPSEIGIPIRQKPQHVVFDEDIGRWGANSWIRKGSDVLYVQSSAPVGIVPTATYVAELGAYVGDFWFEINAKDLTNVDPSGNTSVMTTMVAKGTHLNNKLEAGQSYTIPVEICYYYAANFECKETEFLDKSPSTAMTSIFAVDTRKVG